MLVFLTLFAHTGRSQYNIDTANLLSLDPKLLGVNMAYMYGQVDADAFDSTGTRYIDEKYSKALADNIAKYNPGILRFPGGTIANYYHFHRSGGYGSDTLDLLCKHQTQAGTYPYWYISDRQYSKNFIEPYIELNQILQSKNKPAATIYVANITGPIYKGAFYHMNASVKNHLRNWLGSNYDFFEKRVSSCDTSELQLMADYVYTIYNDAAFKDLLKLIIAGDSTVQNAISENRQAIKYLLDNGIGISGIELGNELYNDYLIFDDDISSNTFDCNDLDSLPPAEIPNPTRIVDLPAIEVMTGMIKLWVMSELLQDSLKTVITAEYGFPFDIPYSYMVANDVGGVNYNRPYGALYKLAWIWNYFWAKHEWIDAAIVHTYMQGFMACDSLQTHPLEFLTDIGTRYTRFYTKQSIDADLVEIERFTGDKKVWITEWNMNEAALLGGTFTHTAFAAEYFINMLRRMRAAPGKYEYLVYHNMCNGGSSNYSLFTTHKNSALSQATVRWQMPFYSHLMFSRLVYSGFKSSDISFRAKFSMSERSYLSHAVFYRPEDRTLAMWYVNYSTDTLYFDLASDTFSIQNAGLYTAVNEGHIALQAAHMLSTNDPCPQLPSLIDTSFVFGEVEVLQDRVALAPLSTGIVQMKLVVPDRISLGKSKQLNIYPNPASGKLTATLSQPQQNTSWTIYNGLGQKIDAHIQSVDDQMFDLNVVGKGYHLIIVHFSDGSSISGKIVLQ